MLNSTAFLLDKEWLGSLSKLVHLHWWVQDKIMVTEF